MEAALDAVGSQNYSKMGPKAIVKRELASINISYSTVKKKK